MNKQEHSNRRAENETNRKSQEQVEETKNKEEAKEVIEKAGMKLTDEELDQVTGGKRIDWTNGFPLE